MELDICLQNTVLHFFWPIANSLFLKTCPAELLSDLLGLIWCSFAIGAVTNAFPYFCTSFGLHSTLERFSPGREPEWSTKQQKQNEAQSRSTWRNWQWCKSRHCQSLQSCCCCCFLTWRHTINHSKPNHSLFFPRMWSELVHLLANLFSHPIETAVCQN